MSPNLLRSSFFPMLRMDRRLEILTLLSTHTQDVKRRMKRSNQNAFAEWKNVDLYDSWSGKTMV